jgi:hypothetical protein
MTPIAAAMAIIAMFIFSIVIFFQAFLA